MFFSSHFCLYSIEHEYSTIFDGKNLVYKNSCFICWGTKECNLYEINPKINTLLNTEVINDEPNPKRQNLDTINEIYLWHLSFGHINQTMIERLVNDGLLKALKVTPLAT